MASHPLLLRIVASSVAASAQAGRIIRDVMSKGDLGIVDKGINDPQTEADRRAQRHIIQSLALQFPKIHIIGEEGDLAVEAADLISPLNGEPRVSNEQSTDLIDQDKILSLCCPEDLSSINEEDLVIWVDPLDGTAEYTQGNLDHVTVLIGVAYQARPVAGIIHQPYYNYQNVKSGSDLGRTIWGIPGVSVGGFTPSPPPTSRIIATTRSHLTPVVQEALDAMQPDQVLKVGGAGYKVLMLLEGKASAYVFASPGCYKWDTCAPQAILEAVGGRMTDIHSKNYPYDMNVVKRNLRGVLATANAQEHAYFATRIPEAVKDKLLG